LHEGTITPLTATGGTTTTITASSTTISSTVTADVVRSKAPPFFAYCTQSVATGPTNVGAARKISGWAAGTCTVAAFPSAVQNTDTFTIREGFYRLPDTFDIEDSENHQAGGFDRVFTLSMMPGKRLEWFGNGVRTYETTLDLMLRIEKRAAGRSAIASAMDNALMFREVIPSPEYRDTMTQVIEASSTEPEVKVDDKNKIVILDRYKLIYRIDTTAF
jgi:hypothetical protein